MELMIISGMSGAGKSKAINALEDVGYYCVDNIPPQFILKLIDLLISTGQAASEKIAVVVDARGKVLFSHLAQALEEMTARQISYKILFLDASTEVLFQRYKESRRRHPLLDETVNLQEAIEKERELLGPLREMAHYTIDTSHTIPVQLRERVVNIAEQYSNTEPMLITLMSFGFRNGIPSEADLVFDVRCLPNPFYIPELRDHTGDEACVRDYVMQWPQTQTLLKKLEDLLEFLVPLYIAEGKVQLVVAVGCTGGKHRSVATAEHLGNFLQGLGHRTVFYHRDKGKTIHR